MSYKQAKFIRDAQQKVLSDMSYPELQAYKYRLWLKLVKAYGSEKALMEAYKKRGITITKPSPPIEISGMGPSRFPVLPDIPIMVPTQRANVYPSEQERDEEFDQIIEMMGDNRLGVGLGFDDIIESPIEVELPVEAEDDEEKEPPRPSTETDYSRQIPDEFRSRQRISKNANQMIQILNKIAAKMRSVVTRTAGDRLLPRMKLAWSSNPSLQNKIIDIFEKNGIFIGHLNNGVAVINRAVDAIFNLPESGLKLIMQDVARAFQNDINFIGNFPIESPPSQTQPPEEVQEPTASQSTSVQQATVDALRQAGVDRGDANRIFERLKNKLQIERTKIFGESGNYGQATDEANRRLVEWVEDTIKYEMGERGLQLNLPNIFRILRDSFPILELIPDRVIQSMPTVRIPTIADATRNLPEEEQKQVFDAVRDAGLVSPAGEIFSYGNIIVRASQSVRDGVDNILRGAGFDEDRGRGGGRGGGGGGGGGGDPDPEGGGGHIEIWNRGDPNAPMLVYSGNLKQILALISLFGGSLTKIESFKTDVVKTDVPPESDEIKQVDRSQISYKAPKFDAVRDASVRKLGPSNLGLPTGQVLTPDIDDKIKVAETDLDNLLFRLNQARMFGANPQQIANLEDQVAKQRQILYIARSSKNVLPVLTPIDEKIKVAETDLDNLLSRLKQAKYYNADPKEIANLEDQVAKQRQILYIARSSKNVLPVLTPIDEKIKVAETDLDNFVLLLNQAKYYNADPKEIANLEDQVAKQKEILYIARSYKNGTDATRPTDTDPTPVRPDPTTPVRPDPTKPVEPDATPDDPTRPTDTDDADDEGVIVPDLEKLESTDTSEGTLIAEYVNPAEVKLFLSTDKETRDEQKRWEEFSRVQPGNGLGNRRTNPLIALNDEYYKKQFQNADKTREKVKPYIVPTIRGIRRKPWSDPQFIDRLDGYEHGKVRFEEDSYNTNRFMSNTLYNPMHTTDQWREFERPSNYHPQLKLAGYRFKPTTIPELRTRAGYKGVDSRPSVNNNINIAPKQTGYEFSPMRRDDNFEGNPQKIRTQLTGFNQPVRIKSTRGGR